MPTPVIRSVEDARPLDAAFQSANSVAVDCEAAGFHRYSDRLCLVQITVAENTYVVDPLAFDPSDLLRGPLSDPAIRVLMHGADYDLRLLDRDLGIHVRGLFDTQVAASLLGEPVLGLSPLLERHLGFKLSKKYQRADWAQRPLSDDMIEYAASDTRHLSDLVDILEADLRRAGRVNWAQEEFGLLETIRWVEDEAPDPVTRVKGARKLGPRDLAALRVALDWRDQIARARDRAPFRIAGDNALVAVAVERPRTMGALQGMKGISRSVLKAEGPELLRRIRGIEELAEDDLSGYPPSPRSGPGRPPPEVEERLARLKEARNARAEELGIARGTLMSNSTLLEVARVTPSTAEELAGVEGVKAWQMEATADVLLTVLT